MATTKEPLVEVRDGKEYDLFPVHHKSKCVGLAPVRRYKDFEEAEAEASTPEAKRAFREWLFTLGMRQAAQDVMNAVRAKYNKDKVSATTVINAIGAGTITPEMQQQAVVEMQAGKYKTFTDACAAYLGIGEDALKNADPSHVHWDCAK